MIDRDALVDRETGAALAGIEPSTLDSWVKRGRLARSKTGARGKALYRVGAVLDAERITRQNSRRLITRVPRQAEG